MLLAGNSTRLTAGPRLAGCPAVPTATACSVLTARVPPIQPHQPPLLPDSFFFFFKYFIYLFTRVRHTERARDTGRGRIRLPAGSPLQDSILGPGDHALSEGRHSTTGPPRCPARQISVHSLSLFSCRLFHEALLDLLSLGTPHPSLSHHLCSCSVVICPWTVSPWRMDSVDFVSLAPSLVPT